MKMIKTPQLPAPQHTKQIPIKEMSKEGPGISAEFV